MSDTETRTRRSPKQIDMAAELANDPGECLTYLAGPEDPAVIKWNGHLFNANVPKRITDEAMIQSARTNKFWHVGPFDAQAHAVALSSTADAPTNSDQYRAHIVAWLKNVRTIDDLVKTWVAEANMREMCGVGSDDYSYLGTLFNPRMHELAMQAELNNAQLADLWRHYGVFQLPF